MKTLDAICLTGLVVAGVLPGAHGQDFRRDINPALVYYRAFLVAAPPMSEADAKYLASKKGKEQ